MAQEIQVAATFKVNKGNIALGRNLSEKVTMSGNHYTSGVQNIGTAYEQVVLGSDVATAGVAFFQNNDASNYVDIGVVVSSTFYPLVRLLPGEFAKFRLSSNTFYAQSHTAATDLEFLVVEN